MIFHDFKLGWPRVGWGTAKASPCGCLPAAAEAWVPVKNSQPRSHVYLLQHSPMESRVHTLWYQCEPSQGGQTWRSAQGTDTGPIGSSWTPRKSTNVLLFHKFGGLVCFSLFKSFAVATEPKNSIRINIAIPDALSTFLIIENLEFQILGDWHFVELTLILFDDTPGSLNTLALSI